MLRSHLSRYIICNNIYIADKENFLLEPTYLKAQSTITRGNKIKIAYIYRQEKISRNLLIRNYLLKIEIVRSKRNFTN